MPETTETDSELDNLADTVSRFADSPHLFVERANAEADAVRCLCRRVDVVLKSRCMFMKVVETGQ